MCHKLSVVLCFLILYFMGCSKAVDVDISNHAPAIQNLSASLSSVAVGGSSTINCLASDADNDPLTFTWQASHGTIVGEGNSVRWMAPYDDVPSIITARVSDGRGGSDSMTLTLTSHLNPQTRILVDASHDGGGWWSPQSDTGIFSPSNPHQGKAMADFMRSRGFTVDELPRGAVITDSLLNQYDKVIRAGKYGSYRETELQAYDNFLKRCTSLILISEYLRPSQRDELAERIGLRLAGIAFGNVSRFADHVITRGATSFYYNAGSAIIDTTNIPTIQVLGWLSSSSYVDLNDNGIRDSGEPVGAPVMGIIHYSAARIFFIGDINGIEGMPQPMMSNLFGWAFE